MASTAKKATTVVAFFAWQQGQDERYELVEGMPVKLMIGASKAHDRISGNIFAALHRQLRGSPCWPASADVAVRTKIRTVRRGDIIVICDPARRDSYEADDLKLVAEVLSPSNKGLDWLRKLDEYRAHPTLRHLLLVESETPKATLAVRASGGWTTIDFDGLDGNIELPEIDCRLAMAGLYEGVAFEPEAG